MTEYPVAVVAGHLCLDIFPDLSALPQSADGLSLPPGRLLDIGPATFSTGGAVSNTGLAMNKLGVPTLLMGKIGNDPLAYLVRQVIATHSGAAARGGEHLVHGLLVDERAGTAYTLIISSPGVDRSFLHYRGANDTFGANDVPYDRLAQSSLFHFGYPPLMRRMFEADGQQLTEMFQRAKAAGLTTSLDLADVDAASAAGKADWPGILRRTLPYVDILMPNIEEILFMLRRAVYDDLRRAAGGGSLLPFVTPDVLSALGAQLIDLGVKIVGLKLGARGLYLRTAERAALAGLGRARPPDIAVWADREIWSPCFRVNVVGTTGAGDATVAGFLCALLRGTSIEEAINVAVAVGACNVEAADALGGLRSWEETLQRVECGWAKHDFQLQSPGWQWDAAWQLARKR